MLSDAAIATVLLLAACAPWRAQPAPSPPAPGPTDGPARAHAAWLTPDAPLPDAIRSDGTPTDLPATRPLRTVVVDARGVVRAGDDVLFDPARGADAEAACVAGLARLRARGLAQGFLQLDVHIDARGERHEFVCTVLHVDFSGAGAWDQVAPLLRACTRPEAAFWTVALSGDVALVPEGDEFRALRQRR